MRLRILVFAETVPKPDTQAGDLRFVALLGLLARFHDVDLCVLWNEHYLSIEDQRRYYSELAMKGICVLRHEWRPVAAALAKRRYDLGFFEFYRTAELHLEEFRRCQPQAVAIIDSVEVHFGREQQAAELGIMDRDLVEKNQQRELKTYQNADAVIVVTKRDNDILRRQGLKSRLFVLPIILPMRERHLGPRGREAIFVGGFAWPPNVDGVLWFSKDIWPAVLAAVPEARFTIIGSNPPTEVLNLGKLPGISVLGYVPETAPYLDRATVSVAPLRYGGGMKGKVIEAMASGLPVVTTSIGADGIPAIAGEHLLMTDNAGEFAKAIVKLLQEPESAERIGLAGQQLAVSICSPSIVESALSNLIDEVAPRSRSFLPPLRWALHSSWYHLLAVLHSFLRYPILRAFREAIRNYCNSRTRQEANVEP